MSSPQNQTLHSQGQIASPSPAAPAPGFHPKALAKASLSQLLLALACLGIVLLLTALGYSLWLSGRAEGRMERPAPPSSGALAAAPLSAANASSGTLSDTRSSDLENAAAAAVDAALKRDELLLDKLLLLVGLYSTILSTLALVTVFFSRQDAKDQLRNIDASAKSLSEDVQKRLDAIKARASNDLQELKEQITSEFPNISRLQVRIHALIHGLEANFPEDMNWNPSFADPAARENWESEMRQQDVLIDEMQIVAVGAFAFDQTELVKLYLALARFYFVRFKTISHQASDEARAFQYADHAVQCRPSSSVAFAEAYRMRGVCTFDRYYSATPDDKKTDEFKRMLQEAQKDFIASKELDPTNAGAYYNLALVYDSQGMRPNAVEISEDLLAILKDVPRNSQIKYLADIYINLACYLADQARATKNPPDRTPLHAHILAVCTECRDYLRDSLHSSRATDQFKSSLERELREKGDLGRLPAEVKVTLRALL